MTHPLLRLTAPALLVGAARLAAAQSTAQVQQAGDTLPARQQKAPAERPAQPAQPVLVYSVNRTPESPFETSREVEVITREEIARRNPHTFYDVLREAGVYMSQTNAGGTSQVASMRGWEGKDILVLVDGVQANNAMYRFNLSLIDPQMIERVEVVKGVGSVLGSEALGGIINIITRREPEPGMAGATHVTASSRYQAGSRAATQYASLFGQTARFRYRAGGTYQDNADIHVGGDAGVEGPSRYIQRSVHGSADWFVADEKTLNVGGWGTQMRPLRTDRYLDKTYLAYYEPEFERHAHVRYTDITDRGWANMLQATAYYHRDDEGMQRIDVRTPTVLTDRPSVGNLYGVNLEMGSLLRDGQHRLVYGVDYSYETVDATLTNTNLSTGAVTTGRGRYTDGSTFRTAALYLQDRFRLGARVRPTLGLRWATFHSTGYENTSAGEYDITGTNSAASASLNTLVELTRTTHLVVNAASGFRAPNIDDLSTIERRITGLEVPNPGLAPERVSTVEAGLKLERPRFRMDAFYFYSYATDVIKRAPGTYKGLTFVDANGNGVKDAGELDAIQKQNIGTFRIQGPELAVRATPLPSLHLSGNYQFLVGRDIADGTYLFRLPPAYGTNRVRWQPRAARGQWLEAAHNWALAQHRLSPEDSVDVRIGPDGTAGYNLLSVRGGMTVLSRVGLQASVENVFDTRYQYHGSATYQPGREYVLRVNYGL